MSILTVDDSSTMRRIIKNSLNDTGFDVMEAPGGEEALAILQANADSIELVLLDWNMPGMNGLEVLQAIKANDAIKHIPVMMVTTEAERANVVTAVQAGASQYLTKPFQPDVLKQKIDAILGGG